MTTLLICVAVPVLLYLWAAFTCFFTKLTFLAAYRVNFADTGDHALAVRAALNVFMGRKPFNEVKPARWDAILERLDLTEDRYAIADFIRRVDRVQSPALLEELANAPLPTTQAESDADDTEPSSQEPSLPRKAVWWRMGTSLVLLLLIAHVLLPTWTLKVYLPGEENPTVGIGWHPVWWSPDRSLTHWIAQERLPAAFYPRTKTNSIATIQIDKQTWIGGAGILIVLLVLCIRNAATRGAAVPKSIRPSQTPIGKPPLDTKQTLEMGATVLGKVLASLEMQMGGVVREIESHGIFVPLPKAFDELLPETQELELAHALQAPLLDIVSPRELSKWATKDPEDQELWEDAKATLCP